MGLFERVCKSDLEKATIKANTVSYNRILLNKKYEDYPQVKATCLVLKEKFVTCANILSLLVDIYAQENTKESNTLAKEVLISLFLAIIPFFLVFIFIMLCSHARS